MLVSTVQDIYFWLSLTTVKFWPSCAESISKSFAAIYTVILSEKFIWWSARTPPFFCPILGPTLRRGYLGYLDSFENFSRKSSSRKPTTVSIGLGWGDKHHFLLWRLKNKWSFNYVFWLCWFDIRTLCCCVSNYENQTTVIFVDTCDTYGTMTKNSHFVSKFCSTSYSNISLYQLNI